jgi:putative tryptophan/tyrosine transport system substrate-binding protein
MSARVKRRAFITLLGSSAVAWPLAARAQQPAKVARIGHLDLGPPFARASRVEALRAGLRDLGWIEGKNIVIEFRWADGVQQLHELAAELVRMNVDVIFAPSSTMVEPARQATKTIPIVFSNHADPIGTGHVASLSRPGGNITGLSELATDLDAKAMELLKEAVPATRIGVLWNPTTPSQVPGLQSVRVAGEKLGLALHIVPAARTDEFDARVGIDGARKRRQRFRRAVATHAYAARSSGRACIEASAADNVRRQGERGGGWPHELRR